MKLTIITINRNNAVGLKKTMQSVLSQTCKEFEYIVVDGASTDESVEIATSFQTSISNFQFISEPDTGIYNAMNKGIRMASGNYVQFLNSGDCLVNDRVVENMLSQLAAANYPPIFYGNMLKNMPNGRVLRDKCYGGKNITFLFFYIGTLNHSPAYISRNLFEKYGYYDEALKIVSDWKWYMQTIALGILKNDGESVPPIGSENVKYTDLDVTLFDMMGISETNKDLDKQERRNVLEKLVPSAFLSDYERWSFSIDQMKRLQRHPWAYKCVWFLERCLFKIEKRRLKRVKA